MSGQWNSIVAVWVLAVVGATLTGAFARAGETLAGVGLTLAGCTLITLCLQLATGRKEGYVIRVTASIVGAVIVLSTATVVFAAVGLA
ncbi:hypothetical protein GY21_02165 [Cryobacterium roopkundense]|uniref:Uncharacterized protein n=1 Tax=Cryobacterium roopkundense TaxID=1001240 RepID=A0A099JTM9_9MICO|nr:hypothetical protein [Cryobacterium roopkundense]KGJ80798.1 hypothetical protein GY21_02165 [Cryobacterium roopkundense]MBB5639696.1 hypothetical protein [Cryobacterium roopkundense]